MLRFLSGFIKQPFLTVPFKSFDYSSCTESSMCKSLVIRLNSCKPGVCCVQCELNTAGKLLLSLEITKSFKIKADTKN